MNIIEKNQDRSEMNKETLEYFLKGLRQHIKQGRLGQGKVAKKAGTTGETMSKYLNRRGDPSESWRESITAVLGVSESDLVLLGKKMANSNPVVPFREEVRTPERSTVEGHQGGYLDVMTSVSRLVAQFQKNEDRLKFWREMFAMLPVPALIIREGSVIYQNAKSLEMGGDICGGHLCDNCFGKGCGIPEDCPTHIAIQESKSMSGYKVINGVRYKVDVSCIRWQEMEYFIVLINDVSEG